jgi:hypothetical protein
LGFEPSHEWLASRGDTLAPRRNASRPTQGDQASRLEPVLVSADTACRTTEGPGDLVLRGPAMLHEIHHRVALGHPIRDRVVRHDRARDNDDAKSISRPDDAAIIDKDGPAATDGVCEETRLSLGSCHGKSLAFRVDILRSKEADRFGSPPLRRGNQ